MWWMREFRRSLFFFPFCCSIICLIFGHIVSLFCFFAIPAVFSFLFGNGIIWSNRTTTNRRCLFNKGSETSTNRFTRFNRSSFDFFTTFSTICTKIQQSSSWWALGLFFFFLNDNFRFNYKRIYLIVSIYLIIIIININCR